MQTLCQRSGDTPSPFRGYKVLNHPNLRSSGENGHIRKATQSNATERKNILTEERRRGRFSACREGDHGVSDRQKPECSNTPFHQIDTFWSSRFDEQVSELNQTSQIHTSNTTESVFLFFRFDFRAFSTSSTR